MTLTQQSNLEFQSELPTRFTSKGNTHTAVFLHVIYNTRFRLEMPKNSCRRSVLQAVVTFFSNIVVLCISLSHGYIIAPRLPDVMPVSVSSGTSTLPYTYSMLTMAVCVQDLDSAVYCLLQF